MFGRCALTAFSVITLAACSNGATTGTAATDSVATSSPGTIESTTTSTAATTTTVPASTTTVAPMDAAVAAWPATLASMGSGVVASRIGTVDGAPAAAMVVPTPNEVSMWRFVDGRWVRQATFEYFGVFFDGVDPSLSMIDRNGDGSDEMLLEYNYGNGFAGEFYWFHNGQWSEVASGENMSITGDTLGGYTTLCIPSCASGPAIEYRVEWDGSQFVTRELDAFGNPLVLEDNRKCGALTPREFEPLQLCDTGDSVRLLQEALYEAGVFYGPDGLPADIDGQFGPDTAYAVRVYQLSIGQPVDGIVQGQWYHDLIEGYVGFEGD